MHFRCVEAQRRTSPRGLWVRPLAGEQWLSLAGTARQLWEEFEYPADLEDVLNRLVCQFGDPANIVEAGIRRGVAQLMECGLLERIDVAPTSADRDRQRYLWLLKRSLANLLYPEYELYIEHLRTGDGTLEGYALDRYFRDLRTLEPEKFDTFYDHKLEGKARLGLPYTMSGKFRIENIERCAEHVFADNIPGDFMEAGVCRGGASIFMRALQVVYGQSHRKLWLADSFEGLPRSDGPEDSKYDLSLDEEKFPWIACDLETVRENFRRHDLLGPAVQFLPGWLDETLPRAPIGDLALLRLDADLYSSTFICLEHLYDRVVPGGYVIVDDYGIFKCCRDAVEDFRAQRNIVEPIEWVDSFAIFWRKQAAAV